MDDSINTITGLMLFLALALVGFIVYLIKIWNEPDSVFAIVESNHADNDMEKARVSDGYEPVGFK